MRDYELRPVTPAFDRAYLDTAPAIGASRLPECTNNHDPNAVTYPGVTPNT